MGGRDLAGPGHGLRDLAASQYVTAVGGTTLTSDTSAQRGWSETAWDQTSSGCSAYDAKPSWQTDTGCADRTVTDLGDAGGSRAVQRLGDADRRDHVRRVRDVPGRQVQLHRGQEPIDVHTCNGTGAQSWTIEPNGTLEVLGHCLDVTASGSADGTLVDLYACNGSGSQQWRWLTNQTLVNPESGKCLDDPDTSELDYTQLEIHTCDGNVEQNWEFNS